MFHSSHKCVSEPDRYREINGADIETAARFLNRMREFFKSGTCPSSQDLLAFRTGDLEEIGEMLIEAHVSLCDFCSAELDLYEHVPVTIEEEVTPSDIPAALYQLAQALLSNTGSGLTSLNRLVSEMD